MMEEIKVRLDHCVIAVSDWERSTNFYRDVLGAEVVDHPDGRVAYRFGDQQLNVHGPGLDIGPLVASPPVAPGGSDLCFVWPAPSRKPWPSYATTKCRWSRDRSSAGACVAGARASTFAIRTVLCWN